MITSSAIRQGTLIFSIPAPARHHHIIHEMARQGFPLPIIGQQGFLDNKGNFHNREEAGKIALKEEQIRRLYTPPELFSEDLW